MQVTEAILNSDLLALGGMGDVGPMGISMASVSSNPPAAITKTTITNASFKTKKLPGTPRFLSLLLVFVF